MFWYGKAVFFLVEVPRRFMVTILGLVVMPEIEMQQALVWAGLAACLAFDLLVVRRAPDVRLGREEVAAKLGGGAEPVFLTVREVKRRFGVVALGAVGLMAVAYYWYSHGQQPVLLTQLLIAAVLLGVTGYLSALGVPLRTQADLPEGERPFVMSWYSLLSRYAIVRNLAYPLFPAAALLIIWAVIIGVPPYEGRKAFTGESHVLLLIILNGYLLWVICLLFMCLHIVSKKALKVITQDSLPQSFYQSIKEYYHA